MMSLLYTNLENWYTTNWLMHRHYNFSLTELEDLMPFERDLYVDMIQKEQEKEKMKHGR